VAAGTGTTVGPPAGDRPVHGGNVRETNAAIGAGLVHGMTEVPVVRTGISGARLPRGGARGGWNFPKASPPTS
jgi:hypothetical protein